MENNEAEIKKKRTKKVVLFSLGTLVLGTLAFFGIKHFKKTKNENNDNTDNQTTDNLDSETPVQTPAHTKSHTGLPPSRNSDAFPLRLGAKGDKVRLLQQALLRAYGAAILAKYGADGQFGNELESALRSKGYAVPLQEADFLKITGEKKEETKAAPATISKFDPAAIAKGIYYSIVAKDYTAAITLLKGIRDTTNYSLVSGEFKNYRINGVRQTLVNAMLGSFSEKSQKQNTQTVLKSMGLKYDGKTWKI